MSTKYYRSNLRGSFHVDGVGDVPPAPSYLKTSDKKKQELLKKHSRNGHSVGFSEVEAPQPIQNQDKDGNKKTKKTAKSGKDAEPKGKEVDADTDSDSDSGDGLNAEDVTNAQLAKKYLNDNHPDEVDGRTLTTAAKIREAAEGLGIAFPNWESK